MQVAIQGFDAPCRYSRWTFYVGSARVVAQVNSVIRDCRQFVAMMYYALVAQGVLATLSLAAPR